MDRLTPEEIAEFKEIFNLVDKDEGGSITKAELGELMDTLGIDATPEEIDAMINEIDQGLFHVFKWIWQEGCVVHIEEVAHLLHSFFVNVLLSTL